MALQLLQLLQLLWAVETQSPLCFLAVGRVRVEMDRGGVDSHRCGAGFGMYDMTAV